MKHILSILLLFISGAMIAQNGKPFTISGSVKGTNSTKKIYLELSGTQPLVVLDSVALDASKRFMFKNIEKNEGTVYQLNFFGRYRIPVLIEGGETIEVVADGIENGNYTVKGSKNNDDFQKLMAMNKAMEEKVRKWQDGWAEAEKKKDAKKTAQIQGEFEAESVSFVMGVKQLLPTMGTSLSALMATNFINPQTDFPFLEELAAKFAKERPTMKEGQTFVRNVRRMRGIRIGDEAPELTLPTPDGKTLSLSSLKGKIVLIDFWASWCGPCRAENPNVVRAYHKFKEKGFDILGVSLDSNKDAWLKAIEKDGLVWNHISDLKQWKSVAVDAYSVSGIPAAFLIDKDGKIIAMNLRGEALDQKLTELLK